MSRPVPYSRPFLARARHGTLLLALLVGPLLVQGCAGLVQTIGARWATRKLAAEFDLDDAQRQATRAAVDRLLDAAPEVLGPPLEILVVQADRAIAMGLSEQNLATLEVGANELADEVALKVIDEAAPILATLRDEQIDHAERRIRKRFEEAREDLEESGPDRLEQRQDQFIDAIEKWTGRLTRAQEALLREHVTTYPDETRMRMEQDEQRLSAIGQTLRSHSDTSAIRDALWKAWKERGYWGPQARPEEVRRADNRRALIYIDSLIDSEQRRNAREHLHSLHRRVVRFLGLDEA